MSQCMHRVPITNSLSKHHLFYNQRAYRNTVLPKGHSLHQTSLPGCPFDELENVLGCEPTLIVSHGGIALPCALRLFIPSSLLP